MVRAESGQVDGNDAPAIEQLSFSLGQRFKHPDQINFRCGFPSKVVSYPPDPLQKIWVVTRKPDQAQSVLDQRLAHSVYEWCVVDGISSVVFLGNDKGGRWKVAMQLHDSWLVCVKKVLIRNHDVIMPERHGRTAARSSSVS